MPRSRVGNNKTEHVEACFCGYWEVLEGWVRVILDRSGWAAEMLISLAKIAIIARHLQNMECHIFRKIEKIALKIL